ncbi:UNKNOWN [Stylonychia lemnae]|uniref:C2HC/C3H-type domain-containing protein n=1 Tax=Stylonychia lemnae TaxID=5949 RepID=A0A078AX09_STYLE|nr:UNKNOWN [Stylonychia lemnae]|eukprot:CDW86596.1 UNKNOWN [Stylonychia lemnae]
MCKKLPKGTKFQTGLSVIHTIQSIENGINQQFGDAQGRHACMVCGRKFTIDRINTHENVCRRRQASGSLSQSDMAYDPSHSIDPSSKPKMMTLNDFNRPKSKQMSKMPSLKNKPLPEKKQPKQIKAFAGSGVRLGSIVEEETKQAPLKTFTGLQKINKNQPKLDFKWRCLNCMQLNKAEEHKTCPKCGCSRLLKPEEQKQQDQEELELAQMMQEWGNIEQLEDQREDILDFISELEIEATQIFICYTLEKMIMILGNIISKPSEEKYKVLKMDNQVFYSNIGRFSTGIKFIKYLGFETIRLENNKLAYKYSVPTVKGIHPMLLLCYDELRTALAKNQSEKLGQEEKKGFDVPETSENGLDERVNCAFCQRKFARDRVDTHQFICVKLQKKPKRKAWDGSKRRLKGTVFENYKPMYKNYFHDRFEICLSRRDQANMEKILLGLKMTKEEYYKRSQDLKLDNNWYFRCKECRDIIHEKLCESHKCQLYEDDFQQEEEKSSLE